MITPEMLPVYRSVLPPIAAFLLFAVYTPAQQRGAHPAPRLWTDAALKTWALRVAGVNATPK